jgi:translocation and assembly module TamB
MIKNKFVRLVLFITFVGVSFVVLLTGLSMTQTSSRWFVNWLVKTNDIPLTIERIEGRLIDRVSMYGLHYKDNEGNEVTLSKFVFDWTPSEILSYKVQVNHITLDNLSYQYTSDSSDESIELPEITLPTIPVAVSVNELTIQNSHLLIDDVEQYIQQIKSSLMIDESGLVFQLQELISEQQALSGRITVGKSKKTNIDGLINWNGILQKQAGQGEISIKGTQDNLVVDMAVDAAIKGKLEGNINLNDKPYRAVINGEFSGELIENISDQFIIDAPIVFSLSGDLNHISSTIDTHAKLASGDELALKVETEAVIQGEDYDDLTLNVNWSSIPDVPENVFLSLKGQGDFQYANNILHIDHELESPSVFNVKGNVNFGLETVDLSMQWDELSLPISDTDLLQLHTGLIKAKGKLDTMTISLETDYMVNNADDAQFYNSVSANGVVNLLAEQPVGQITGTVKTAVPENLKEYIGNDSAIDFVLSSEVERIKINANTDFQSEQLGDINLKLASYWKDSVLTLDSLNVDVLDGNLEVNGSINLQDKTDGTFNIKGYGLNVGVIKPDLESKLDLNAEVVLSETDKGLSTEIDMTSLSGEWRGFPLAGSARLAYLDDTYQIEKLNLRTGSNTVAINLNIDKLLNGFVDLSIHDLSLFSSELAGAINGRMEVSGSIESPTVEGKLNGNNLFINDVRIASLSADSNIDLRPKQHSSIKLKLNTLRYQDYVFDEVFINGEGLTETHKFDVVASSSSLNVSAVVNAGLIKSIWSGQIAQLELTNEKAGLWQLTSPSNYTWQFQDNTFNLQNSCLSQDAAHLCISATGKTDANISGNIDVSHLPLKLVEPMLPETMLLQGDVSGVVKFNLLEDNWTLTSGLESSDTKIGAGYENEPEYIDVDHASIKFNVDKEVQELSVKLSSKDYFDISLTGSIQDKNNKSLNGKLDLVFNDIKWLENIEPTLSGSHGQFQVNITAEGTAQRPEINGNYFLNDGILNVFSIGLSLDKVKGKIQTGDNLNQVNINSVLASMDKELLVNGFINLHSENNYPYEFDVRGESFPLVRTADVKMDVSPEIKLSGTKDLHYIRGQLTVPLLDMLISSLPESAVSVSPDVVIIQSKQADATHVTNGNGEDDFVKNHIDLDVDVFLKPDIHIEGFGLDTRLTGDIKITKPVGVYQPRGEGYVQLADGSYQAYGQDLVIESGRLLFAGPLDNPGINLRAYRPKLKVKAGVMISGNVNQPKLNLFSEPTQSEADTLSYLITGRPISGASGGEASLIAQAALSLGTQESSVLTNQIQSMFGLDDFSVGGSGTVDNTSVNASKRLSPKLTFKSSFNPFDQLWAFFLNYKLTDNWSVQTESGVSQGADIIYSIESNTWDDLFERLLDIFKFQ